MKASSLPLRAEGAPTPVLTYAGTDPILLLRGASGQEACLDVRNLLAESTSLQICGLRGLGTLDDATLAAIPAGGRATLSVKATEGGLALLRPRLGPSDQGGRGLGGVVIVDPPNAPAVDHDLVFLLKDWAVEADNRIAAPSRDGLPAPVSVVTVNLKTAPADHVVRPGARLRLRLINGSIRRMMVVACDGAKPMIVAIDGQPSELFQPIRDTVPIGPGARFELVVDAPRESGTTIRLTLRGSEQVGGALEPDRPIATIRTEGAALDAKSPIAALPPNPALPTKIPLERSKRAELTIDGGPGGWSLNGVSGIDLPKQPVLRVKQGDAVTLGFSNASRALVPLSLYGQALRLLHKNDDGWEPYWRDTVVLPPGSRNHAAFVADTPGRWLIESGFNDQAAMGLRCWFEVAPG